MIDILLQLPTIFYRIVGPILLMAGVGWLLQRKGGLDLSTLRRLNFHFVLPAMVYHAVVNSSLTLRSAAIVVGFGLAMLLCLGFVTLLAARIFGVRQSIRRALLMTTMYHNSGNYALPLQALAFGPFGLAEAAVTLQALTAITQNFTGFTLGVSIASGGRHDRHWRENVSEIVKFPPIYALAAGIATVLIRSALGDDAAGVADALAPFWSAITYTRHAFVAVALVTLGAQLATVSHQSNRDPLALSIVLRLLGGPAIALGLIYLFGIEGLLAQVLLIGSATPTAVNPMLLCLQFNNHPDFAARAVFYSTLLSPINVSLAILLAQGGYLPGF